MLPLQRATLIRRSHVKSLATGLLLWLSFALLWIVAWVAFRDLEGWPINDDPFYAKPIEFLDRNGTVQFVRQNGVLTASSIAHVLMGTVTVLENKFSYRSLFAVCIVQQSFGAATIYFLCRGIGLSRAFAVLASGTLALFPLYYGHAFTFMTDGPATAWAAIACTAFIWGTLRNDARWLLTGSVAIGWGYWIRQTNLLLLLAPLLMLVLQQFGRSILNGPGLRKLAATVGFAAFACGLFESGGILTSSIERATDVAPISEGYTKRVLIAVYGFALLCGWYSIPWLPIMVTESIRYSNQLNRTASLTCLALSLTTLLGGSIPLALTYGKACLTNSTGTFIQNAHFGPVFLSDMDEPGRWSDLAGVVWPLWVWTVLSAISLVSISLLAWWATWNAIQWVQDGKTRDLQLTVGLGLLVMIVVSGLAISVLVEPHMDRYWMFLFPAIVLWLSLVASKCQWRMTRFAAAWATCWFLLNGAMSLVFTHDMLAWNDARWHFVNEFLASGAQPDSIDGGRDVNAWLRLDEDPNTHPRPGDRSKWWSGRATMAISVGSRPGWHEVKTLPWIAWATGGSTHSLLVLERDNSDSFRNFSSIHSKSTP